MLTYADAPLCAALAIHTYTWACASVRVIVSSVCTCIRQHTSAYVSIRQHTSAYVSIRQHTRHCLKRLHLRVPQRLSLSELLLKHTSAYVSIRQHTSAYLRVPQRLSLSELLL
jgi:hypothetical protein